jgi:hypothetical protein
MTDKEISDEIFKVLPKDPWQQLAILSAVMASIACVHKIELHRVIKGLWFAFERAKEIVRG